jgi:hypothetical protein
MVWLITFTEPLYKRYYKYLKHNGKYLNYLNQDDYLINDTVIFYVKRLGIFGYGAIKKIVKEPISIFENISHNQRSMKLDNICFLKTKRCFF